MNPSPDLRYGITEGDFQLVDHLWTWRHGKPRIQIGWVLRQHSACRGAAQPLIASPLFVVEADATIQVGTGDHALLADINSWYFLRGTIHIKLHGSDLNEKK